MRMPVLFIGHGSPMTIEQPQRLAEWQAWGKSLPRPKAILMVSAAKSTYLPSLYCATFFAMGSSGTFQGSRASSFSRLSASPICAST